jgi:hypothetical protein
LSDDGVGFTVVTGTTSFSLRFCSCLRPRNAPAPAAMSARAGFALDPEDLGDAFLASPAAGRELRRPERPPPLLPFLLLGLTLVPRVGRFLGLVPELERPNRAPPLGEGSSARTVPPKQARACCG